MGFIAILVPPLNQVGMAADDNGIAGGRPNMRFRGHNADLLFGRVVPPGCPPDVANKRLGRRRRGAGFLSCISTTSRQGCDAGRGGGREAVSVLVFKTVDEPGAPLVVPVNPNSRSVRTVRPHSQGRVMEQSFVGIDVAKDRLDVHVRPSGDTFALARDGEGVAALSS